MKAFPHTKPDIGTLNDFQNTNGMDLRDYFAAKAMQANLLMMSKIVPKENITKKQAIAFLSYEMADEMMKAREQ
mgnify:CR=1 FL=1